MKLIIKDETFSGDFLNEIEIAVEKEIVTIKDIISARVEAEVERYNNITGNFFNGLIQPTGTEQTLNGFRMKKNQKIDLEKQVYVALDAFLKNSYFILIDNFQGESLEQEVLLTPDTNVSFVKLTPLVGG